ncbi:PaaI family thioesterase [Acuticoccus sp. I52.16.1]|uniref:PaaI family thioesterase n=1 Tax=Acuticoccus sp. I52.16.1 TaxID=2928472 RepID=UPI001FD47B14|nr:PaaI family thioesterase [Acuticoccus sp. I52.16.1]UOM33032.1 PaaI family thioesterase [Acuticoccus sp. I52.16.1]
MTAYPDLDPALKEAPYPLEDHLGYELVTWAEDLAVFRMPVRTFHRNRYGIPHGGLYTVLLDTVMGYAGCYTGDPAVRRFAMTLSLTTNYLAQPGDDLLIAEGRRVGGGKRIYFGEGTVFDGNGTVCARATGTFRYRTGG